VLTKCRLEAEDISLDDHLMKDAGIGKENVKDKKVRGDRFIWLTQAIDGAEGGNDGQLRLTYIKELVRSK
jgi:hypothetical protein